MDEKILIKQAVEATPINLPNGRVGEMYRVEIPFQNNGVEDYSLEGLGATGLSLEKSDKGFVISGTAQPEDIKGGDYELVIRYKPKGLLPSETWFERTLHLIINPDPRTLWKDIPTPHDIDYFKEDTQMEYLKVEAIDGIPQKDIVAASQRGRSHANEGKPRDDHFKLYHDDATNWYVIAVADGAGSAKYSREGSRIACETVVEHCKTELAACSQFEDDINLWHLDQGSAEAGKAISADIYRIVGNAAYNAHKAINAEASAKRNSPKDYATTLLLAICKRFEFGWFVASFWVGDGAMCLYNKDTHTATLLGTPDEGEFAGQTRFLTMPDIFQNDFYSRLKCKIVHDFTALLLMTDGVSDPKFETDANLQNVDKWDDLWNDLKENGVELTDDNEKSQEQLLEWLKFWSRGNHDDRTIAILY